jgi:hypothetical protein
VGPFEIDALVGATLSRDIEAGQPFEPQDLFGGDVQLKLDTTSDAVVSGFRPGGTLA